MARSTPAPKKIGSSRVALAFIAGLAAFLLLPRINTHGVLTWSFAGSALSLFAWYLWTKSRQRGLKVEISLRPQHYLQAIAHTAIFVYWGMYWEPIQDAALLIAGQIVFAYAFDALLSWNRRGTFVVGFGPFPIIYSTNLFLRFRDDWFYLQFVMVAVGFLVKELIQWERDGRRVHIFNPSSFPLALFSLVLILTNTSSITWAEEIATLLILPPHIYLFIFLVALPGQFLFGVTMMTLPAVLTTYLFSVAYLAATGSYFFFDSNVPIAVFLGMHLLFTDPSTSPKSELGRILFGITYGLSVVALYAVLDWAGAPTYYDKLLQVPIMNLLVKQYDRVGRSATLAWLNPASLGAALAPRMRGAAYTALWVIVFAVLAVNGGLANYHPGQTIPFWESACAAGRVNGCRNLAEMHERYCGGGSAWSCNELGVMDAASRADIGTPQQLFKVACSDGLRAACENVSATTAGRPATHHGDPRVDDYLVVLQGGRGPIPERTPFEVYTRACAEGYLAACGGIGDTYFQGEGVAKDQVRARAIWEDACSRGHGMSCSNLGVMNRLGDGVPKDNAAAGRYMKRACDLGLTNACKLVEELLAEDPKLQLQ
jgi:TPR repeat protein